VEGSTVELKPEHNGATKTEKTPNLLPPHRDARKVSPRISANTDTIENRARHCCGGPIKIGHSNGLGKIRRNLGDRIGRVRVYNLRLEGRQIRTLNSRNRMRNVKCNSLIFLGVLKSGQFLMIFDTGKL
jgi:hypothetical protein